MQSTQESRLGQCISHREPQDTTRSRPGKSQHFSTSRIAQLEPKVLSAGALCRANAAIGPHMYTSLVTMVSSAIYNQVYALRMRPTKCSSFFPLSSLGLQRPAAMGTPKRAIPPQTTILMIIRSANFPASHSCRRHARSSGAAST